MWTFATVLLISLIGGAFCEDAECRRTESAKCDTSMLPREFPKTLEEYGEDCRNVVTFFDCLTEVLDKCKDDSEEGHGVRRIMLYVQSRVCNPESHIYETLTSNVQCIETSALKVEGICMGRDRDSRQKKLTDALEDYILEKMDIDKDFSLEHGNSCMEDLYGVACSTVMLGEECGIPVGDVILDAVDFTDYILSSCPDHVVNDLPVLVSTIRALAQVEEEVENAIRKKK